MFFNLPRGFTINSFPIYHGKAHAALHSSSPRGEHRTFCIFVHRPAFYPCKPRKSRFPSPRLLCSRPISAIQSPAVRARDTWPWPQQRYLTHGRRESLIRLASFSIIKVHVYQQHQFAHNRPACCGTNALRCVVWPATQRVYVPPAARQPISSLTITHVHIDLVSLSKDLGTNNKNGKPTAKVIGWQHLCLERGKWLHCRPAYDSVPTYLLMNHKLCHILCFRHNCAL